MSSNNNRQSPTQGPPSRQTPTTNNNNNNNINGQTFSAFEFCDRMKYEFEYVNSQLNMYKIENERLRSEKEELIQQSKKFFEMSYFLNANNHKVSEVNERLSNITQRLLIELPEEKRKMYQQEIDNVHNVTVGDIENRIKSKSSQSQDVTMSSTAEPSSREFDKPKGRLLNMINSISVNSPASSITMSKDASSLFVGGKGTVDIFSTLLERQSHHRSTITFSPLKHVRACKLFKDESTLVVSGEGPGIHLFNMEREAKNLTLSTLDSSINYSLCLDRDDLTVFATLVKGTIGMWDLRSNQLVRLFEGHSSPCSSVDIDPSGKVLMSGGLDKTVKMWDISSGKCFQEFQTSSRILSLSNSPSSDLICYGLEEGALELVTYKSQSNNAHTVTKHADCVLTSKFSPKGNYIISGAKGGLLTINSIVDSTFREIASDRLSNSVLSCDVVSGGVDCDYISVGSWDNKVALYKLANSGH